MELSVRKRHRLKDFDYGSYGYYYATICTLNKANILCRVAVGSDALVAPPDALVAPPDVPVAPSDAPIIPYDVKTIPSDIGAKVIACWNNIGTLNDHIEVDQFVLMPNHIHGIIIIKNTEPTEIIEKKYAFEISERRGRRSLLGLIKDFKSVTTRYYKRMNHTDTSLWQESFYDEVIRNEEHYARISRYIAENPAKWKLNEHGANAADSAAPQLSTL